MPTTRNPVLGSPFTLSETDKRRLLRFAPQFGLQVENLQNGRLRITVDSSEGASALVELPEVLAYLRLLLEISSRTARWLYFHQGEHCGQTLLALPDAKVSRLSELYRIWVQNGRPG
jgi:hypothetical protein